MLRSAFAGSSDASRQAFTRWRRRLSPALRRWRAGREEIHASAHLPNGLTARAHLLADEPTRLAGYNLPAGHEQWSAADRQRFLDTHELLDHWDELARQYPRLPDAARVSLLIERSGQWAQQRGLRCSLRSLARYRARLARDGNIDRRGRQPDDAEQSCTPDAWERFKALWLDARRRSVRLCWEIVAAEAAEHGWRWPSVGTVARRVRCELPAQIADYYRRGARYWQRHHAPHVQRDYSAIRPNQIWVGDEHQFDVLVLAAGRPVRPWLTAWQDMRSRLIVGWSIDLHPNADTILRALCTAIRDHGAPLELIIDNGKDYRAHAVTGGKRVDEQRVSAICSRLEIAPHFCIPFNPGAKPVESTFRTVCERFSKLFDSYFGGSPQQRPEDLYRRLRADQVNVPTLDRFRDLFARWVRLVYHRRPHIGDGMNQRSPEDVFAAENPIARRTAPPALLDWLLLKELRRRVTRRGINLDGVYYGQADVQTFELAGQDVLIKRDLDDASALHVCDVQGRYIYTARAQRLAGQTVDDIRAARQRIKAARALVQQAAAVQDTALRDVEDETLLAAQAEYHQQFAATGTDHARPLEILPSAAEILDRLPPSIRRSAEQRAEQDDCIDPLDLAPVSRLIERIEPLDLIDAAPAPPVARAVQSLADPLDALPDPGWED